MTDPLVRLSDASPHIRQALRAAADLGMTGETEAVPLCHLDANAAGADIEEDFARHSVADVHRSSASLADHRETSRPRANPCELRGRRVGWLGRLFRGGRVLPGCDGQRGLR